VLTTTAVFFAVLAGTGVARRQRPLSPAHTGA
jgi:hypothetical protein